MGLSIILLLGFFLLRKRRPQQYQEARGNGSNELASSTLVQRHAVEKSAEQQWELDGNARSEMDGSGRSEMEARRRA